MQENLWIFGPIFFISRCNFDVFCKKILHPSKIVMCSKKTIEMKRPPKRSDRPGSDRAGIREWNESLDRKTKQNRFHSNTCSIPSRQIFRKSSVDECIFDYMALHIECRFNKISLLQCYFLAILPAGLVLL